jgi:biotin carboxyl carrier protein
MLEENKIISFLLDDAVYETNVTKKFINRKKYVPTDPKKVLAYIPGTIKEIHVRKGQEVQIHQPLLVLEAMKMKNDILSSIQGKIKEIYIKIGDMVPKGQVMIEFE